MTYNRHMSVETIAPETTTIDEIASANVRANAAYMQLRQQDLASALGINQATVSKKWHGRRAWQLSELAALADLFGVTVADLVTPRDNDEARADSARANNRGSRDWIRTSNRPINSRMLCR